MTINERFIQFAKLPLEIIYPDGLEFKEIGEDTIYDFPKANINLGKKIPVTYSIPLDGHIQYKWGDEVLQFQCVKIDHKTQQDGTYDEIYILKAT